MKNSTKTLMVCLVLAMALLMVRTTATAQWPNGITSLWQQYPSFMSQPLAVPSVSQVTGDIMIDNFEYWDSPYNHNWKQIEPPYPVYGYGLGYATIFNTTLDLQEGSRVLDVYRPSSVFLIGTPYSRHAIQYPSCGCNPASPINYNPATGFLNPVFSFKFRAPLGIDPFDIFKLRLYTDCVGHYIDIVPLQGVCADCPAFGPYISQETPAGSGNYTVSIGREFLDGSWHVVWINLNDVTYNTATPTAVYLIEASGQMFRMDDIAFRVLDAFLCEPYLFKIGPRYAQFYEPYRFLFFADYRSWSCGLGLNSGASPELILTDANSRLPGNALYTFPAGNLFLTDPNAIRQYWLAQTADPLYGLFDANAYIDPNGRAISTYTDANYVNPIPLPRPAGARIGVNTTYGLPDTTNAAIVADLGASFIVNPTLPVFANPAWRWSATNGIQHPGYVPGAAGAFQWNPTVNGIGSNGIQFFSVQPLPINPYDGMPTYIPTYASEKSGLVAALLGEPYYDINTIYPLEAALFNAGFRVWSGIAYLDYTPTVFEDIILSLEVTNGRSSDYETFPISVVNYPVENYPPYIEDVDDQLFMVGTQAGYSLSMIDPDVTFYSMSQTAQGTGLPEATTHVPAYPWVNPPVYRADMDGIVWAMTLNGLPSYQYGPWMNQLINQKTGIVGFTPQFEGAYDAIVTATDPMGASSVANFTIFCVQQGTWLNHPPIILMDWDHPQVARAGEEFILTTPEFRVIDPDGDFIYYSCNIGSMGRRGPNGTEPMWTFTTNFPGFYTAEIIAYDIRGGYAIVTVDVEVKPWWSF